nr:MAG TPA: hypothetical protein [Caudoviricetes sp.]
MSKQKIRKAVALLASVMVAVSCAVALPACTQKNRVSYNVSQDANNFNIRRRITVFNMRSDKVLLQMEGCFAIETNKDAGELNVICELPDGTYQKHFIYLNDWTMYTVEQLDSSEEDKYSYELNFLPEALPGVSIVSKN